MKNLFLILFVCCAVTSEGQSLIESQYKNLATLEKELHIAKTPEQKTNALISLYLHHALHNEPFNIKAAADYQKQLEIYTHQTRKPELIASAFLYLIRPVTGEEKKRRIDRLYEYSKLHNLNHFKAYAKILEGEYYFVYKTDQQRATQYLNEAINLAKQLDDSLRSVIILEAGTRFRGMNNSFFALQLAFEGQENAQKMQNASLLRFSNSLFAGIYSRIENYNKAIEYHLKELESLRSAHRYHLAARKHALLAFDLFMSGQQILGNYHVTEAYRMTDSIKGSKRLYNEMTGLLLTALTRSENNEILVDFLKKYRQHFFIFPGSEFGDNVTLAVAFAKIEKMDSAKSLMNKASLYFTGNESAGNRRVYYYTLARIAAHEKNWHSAVENWKKALQMSLAQNNLNFSLRYIDSIKYILGTQGLYAEAFRYYNLGDSVQKELAIQLDKEEITRQEVAALEKEKQYQALEQQKELNHRHNLQYLGITAGVVALFISLLLMGIFKVSPRVIKILSFFAFLLFFEFLFLIFKKQVYVFTHGEPWKDLAFMVLLAAVMVPLHHWGEHKVVEYLSSRRFSFQRAKISRNKTLVKKETVS